MGSYADYLSSLHENADAVYAVAEEARSKGFDPKKSVAVSYTHLTLPTILRV